MAALNFFGGALRTGVSIRQLLCDCCPRAQVALRKRARLPHPT